jgi:murein DD-endopeptidase MepM/ murein hydrolase activator NlpD
VNNTKYNSKSETVERIMREKKNIIEKIASGKGFYITAAVSFILIVTAIAFVYNSSVNMLRDLDIPTTFEQVEKNQTNVSDPRLSDDITESDDEYTAEENNLTSQSRQSTTKEVTTEAVTEESTVAAEVFKNDSFIYPLSGDIDRAFSMSPVYDETMEDWRIHKGIDFIADAGSEVLSIGNGKVVKVVSDTSYGYCIHIDYGEFIAVYCGLEQGTTVIIDDVVSKGDVVGKVASVPCESKQESHLHFEIVRGEANVDPKEVLG